MGQEPFKFLLHGIDTLQCSYYLSAAGGGEIDFDFLAQKKEEIRQSRKKDPLPIQLGNSEFLLQHYGTPSGYSFVLINENFRIELGQYMRPNFFVTFRCEALWRESADFLHQKFLKWAASVGYSPYRRESISRVDFSFDYHLPTVDFTEDSFKSRSSKDSQFRENKRVQTFCFGKGDIVLRVYDKIAEIQQQSDKSWFYLLWGGIRADVWRIEWQIRKPLLKRFEMLTFDELRDQQGDILRYLAEEHDTLRIPTNDTNASRWPLHPLWQDLQEQIGNLRNLGVCKVLGQNAVLETRKERIAISTYGNLKRIAAIECLLTGKPMLDVVESWRLMLPRLAQLHDPLTWTADVQKRVKEMELGQW